MTPALAVRGLVAGYRRDLPILHGVELEVAAGEIVTVVGPNGAGKSTLVKAVAGLVPVSEGRVLLAGQDITGMPPHRLAAAGVAYVPQTRNVFATLTIEENLRLGAAALPPAMGRERIQAAYARFPALAAHARSRARALSGGQRQMLAFARALLAAPRLLMLDEPSAGLAPRVMGEVFAMLAALRGEGQTILLVEQNVRAALAVSDRTYVLAEGQNRIDGPSRALTEDPRMASIYLGDMAALPGEGR